MIDEQRLYVLLQVQGHLTLSRATPRVRCSGRWWATSCTTPQLPRLPARLRNQSCWTLATPTSPMNGKLTANSNDGVIVHRFLFRLALMA
jgi:hypothetical protein